MDFGTRDKDAGSSVEAPDPDPFPAPDPACVERNRILRALIPAAARGDIAAFERLYTSTASWLLARVRRIAGSAHAEDVLAEVYLQVWRSLPLYDESRGEPMAWLATIARSRALDRVRTELRSHGGQLDAPVAPAVEESHEAGPEELLAKAEAAALLQLSMGKLSPKERLVLGMAYFRDCTQSEIATLTGLPLGSVKSLMVRSQNKLRQSITASSRAVQRMSHNDWVSPSP